MSQTFYCGSDLTSAAKKAVIITAVLSVLSSPMGLVIMCIGIYCLVYGSASSYRAVTVACIVDGVIRIIMAVSAIVQIIFMVYAMSDIGVKGAIGSHGDGFIVMMACILVFSCLTAIHSFYASRICKLYAAYLEEVPKMTTYPDHSGYPNKGQGYPATV